jgi:hypothetical protein
VADRILTCTWAPTVLAVPQLLRGPRIDLGLDALSGAPLAERMWGPVRQAEELGIDHLLVAQRWWGTGEEIAGSSFDCIAMTAWYAARTERIRLITAIHPRFFLPAPIAKWGASLDRLNGGRWSINVTSGCFHVTLTDPVFNSEVLRELAALNAERAAAPEEP